jgi:hypothetical protein
MNIIKVYHISDIHFHSNPANNTAADNLLTTIYNRHFSDPNAYLLITGDLVDDGMQEQYALIASSLKPFKRRLLACPGNHDCGILGNFYQGEAVKRFHEFIDPLTANRVDSTLKMPFETQLINGNTKVVFIGLNSNLYTSNPLDFACGELGEAQRGKLLELLNRAALMDFATVIYLHHRPFGYGFLEKQVKGLKDSKEFLEIVEDTVDIVAYGHGGNNANIEHFAKMEAELIKNTRYLNANTSVAEKSYFEMVFNGENKPLVNLLKS